MAWLRPTICPCPVAWDRRASVSRRAVRSSTTSRTQTGRLLPSLTRTGVMRIGILRRWRLMQSVSTPEPGPSSRPWGQPWTQARLRSTCRQGRPRTSSRL